MIISNTNDRAKIFVICAQRARYTIKSHFPFFRQNLISVGKTAISVLRSSRTILGEIEKSEFPLLRIFQIMWFGYLFF